jgi:uncharacterized membrane protein
MIIVGFSFWADVDKRLDITLMMILVVAAMYLGICSNLPFACILLQNGLMQRF